MQAIILNSSKFHRYMYHNYANIEPKFIKPTISLLMSAISAYIKPTISLNIGGELKDYSKTKGNNKYPLIKNN